MVLDFDLKTFVEDMRACKPPYKCPFKNCGKVYKTFSGIHFHISSHDSTTVQDGQNTRSPSPSVPFFKSPIKESLVYLENEKAIEFEAEGRIHRFSIYDSLELVSKQDWEESIPVHHNEECEKLEEPLAKSPPSNRNVSSKKGKKGLSKPHIGHYESHRDNEQSCVEGKKGIVHRLPEAHYSVIDDYDIEDAPPMPTEYYRFVEKPIEQLDHDVEYDMDEEDVAWLECINEKRSADNYDLINEDQFELLMDRLEKESYFHLQTTGGIPRDGSIGLPGDDDAICCVCMDGECSNTNVILFCDLCNLAVHQECYGVPYIPEGQWLCRRCLQSPSRSVECCLCPNKGGAFKGTDDGRWAHVVCGLWIPEVRFANTVFLEPIDSIDNIPPARWKLTCRVCKQRGLGACIQCHKTNCYTAFHVTCGLLAGLHMKMDTVRESSSTGLSVTVRKTAYCDVHTPSDSDCTPKLDNVASLGISTPKLKARSPKKNSAYLDVHGSVPVLFRGLMNFSPQCPWEKVQEIASLINVRQKNHFFQRLMAYWTLKRQTRNGVPLIRRLQFAKATQPYKKVTPEKYLHELTGNKRCGQKKRKNGNRAEHVNSNELKEMQAQRLYLRRLRQDLEKVRLLCELIRKREQRKRDLIHNIQCCTLNQLNPTFVFFNKVVDALQEVDTTDLFAKPVSIVEVPDYLDHISTPMDFQLIRSKIVNACYTSIRDLEEDVNLMIENCLSYNENDTVFYRCGLRMRDLGGSILREAKRQFEAIGFDDKTGLLMVSRADDQNKKEIVCSLSKIQEVLSFLENETLQNSLSLDDLLKKLLEYYDGVQVLQSTRKLRCLKLLKKEISLVRRKLSMEKEGISPINKQNNFKTALKGQSCLSNLGLKMTSKGKIDRRFSRNKEILKETSPVGDADCSKRQTLKRLLENKEEISEKPETELNRSKSLKVGSVVDETVFIAADDNSAINGSSVSPMKSPGGVNRRNAVLFTKKKQNAAMLSSNEVAKQHNKQIEEQETEIQISVHTSKSVCNDGGRKGKKKGFVKSKKQTNDGESSFPPITEDIDIPRSPKTRSSTAASFNVYRRPELGTSGTDSSSASGPDSDNDDSISSDGSAECSTRGSLMGQMDTISLEPLDLVWAKCRGYPWYPALIINPKMPRTGYLHNHVPIPVPPQDILDLAESHSTPHYLILFFDAKRTWQWLQKDKLVPLGVDHDLDKSNLESSKKPSERRAVSNAYKEASLHRCRVIGDNASIRDIHNNEKSSTNQLGDDDETQ